VPVNPAHQSQLDRSTHAISMTSDLITRARTRLPTYFVGKMWANL
jgi:hypothetical protein